MFVIELAIILGSHNDIILGSHDDIILGSHDDLPVFTTYTLKHCYALIHGTDQTKVY